MVDPMKAPSSAIRLPFRRGSVEYSLGTEADHEAVYQTLLHVFHGPDREAFDHASNGELKPVKLTGTMAFMFETRFPQRVTEHAAKSATLQDNYADCWKGLEKRFDPNRP